MAYFETRINVNYCDNDENMYFENQQALQKLIDNSRKRAVRLYGGRRLWCTYMQSVQRRLFSNVR